MFIVVILYMKEIMNCQINQQKKIIIFFGILKITQFLKKLNLMNYESTRTYKCYLEEIEKDNCEYPYSIWDAEDILFDLDKNLEGVASELDFDEHRWYIITTNVYKCEDEFVGIRGVSSLKSEMMSYGDCAKHVEIFECEEVPTVTYKRK